MNETIQTEKCTKGKGDRGEEKKKHQGCAGVVLTGKMICRKMRQQENSSHRLNTQGGAEGAEIQELKIQGAKGESWRSTIFTEEGERDSQEGKRYRNKKPTGLNGLGSRERTTSSHQSPRKRKNEEGPATLKKTEETFREKREQVRNSDVLKNQKGVRLKKERKKGDCGKKD